MGFSFKKIFFTEEKDNTVEDEFYTDLAEEIAGAKMVLVEPRAYSEAQGVADHLKSKRTVVVNLKRVTSDQAKRIVDFLSGCIYAIGGDLQKIGGGIFLCTPKQVDVEGEITEGDKRGLHNNDDIDVEW